MTLPVVDYKRMERLRPPENTVIPINANTIFQEQKSMLVVCSWYAN